MKRLFLDFETNEGAIEHELTDVFCCSLKPSDGELFTITENYREVIQGYIDEGYTPVAHNMKFDGWVMDELGIKWGKFHDTMLIHYLLYPYKSHSLASIGEDLGVPKIDFKDFSHYSEEMRVYCERDVELLERAFKVYFSELIKDRSLFDLYINVEIPLVKLLMETEVNGVRIDENGWEGVIGEVENELSEVEHKIEDLITDNGISLLVIGRKSKTKNDRKPEQVSDVPEFGKWKLLKQDEEYFHWGMWEKFNCGSTSQVVDLFNQLGFPIESSKEDVLESIDHPLATLFLEHRKLSKLVSSFGYKLIDKAKNGRLHPSLNQCITKTGRLSCSNPNLQQIPSHGEKGEALRKLFIPSEGYKLVSIDIDAFQMRIYAWYLNEMCSDFDDASVLFNDFKNNPNADPHQAKADLLGVERFVGKTLNFAGIFGQSYKNAAKLAGVTEEEMKGYYAKQEELSPSHGVLIKRVQNGCKRTRGYVYDLYGRRGCYPDIFSQDFSERSRAERQCFNFLIQGTEASIIKQMWLLVWKFGKELGARPVLQVHDEFTFEVPESKVEEFKDVMWRVVNKWEWLPNLKVTGTPSSGNNWFEVH